MNCPRRLLVRPQQDLRPRVAAENSMKPGSILVTLGQKLAYPLRLEIAASFEHRTLSEISCYICDIPQELDQKSWWNHLQWAPVYRD